MATPAGQLDAILATTFAAIRPTLADNITNKNVLLAALNSKDKVTEDGGYEIRRPLMFALNNTVGSYSGYDRANLSPQGGLGYAVYQWRQHFGSVVISGEELLKNSGEEQIISLIQAKVNQLKLSIADNMNSVLFGDGTGNGGKDFLGLQAIIGNTGTLGGVDSATETWWKSVVVSTAVDLTILEGVKTLDNVANTVGVNMSKVDFEITTQSNFEAYVNLALPEVRFTDLKMADLGFEAAAHRRAEVMYDPDCPAPVGSGGGYWYFISSDHLEFVQHSDRWLEMTDFVRPADQDAKAALVLSAGNLVTDMRRGLGVITKTTV